MKRENPAPKPGLKKPPRQIPASPPPNPTQPGPGESDRQRRRSTKAMEAQAQAKKAISKRALTKEVQQLEERRGSLDLAQLENDEKEFFEKIEEGNVSQVDKFINEHRNLNVNCVNFTGLSALNIAIKKENLKMVQLLFRVSNLDFKDAALQAVATGNTEFAESVLNLIKNLLPAREMSGSNDSPDYSPDITPIILAAQNGDYEMVRMLKERGHDIERPHSPDCLCRQCKENLLEAGSSMSRVRLNAYRAICNPVYICQKTIDPILYGFDLDTELKECALQDKEFRAEYAELGQAVREFTVSLLSHCRNTSEVEMLLKVPLGYEEGYSSVEFQRLQLALDHNQKEFVAHSMVQQVLTAYWLGEFRSWPRKSFAYKTISCFSRVFIFPFLCLGLLFAPSSKIMRKYRSPLNRFLMSLASYLLFLLSVFLLNYSETGRFRRGPPTSGFESVIVIFVLGHIWATIRQFWFLGGKRFFIAPWHWYNMMMHFVFVATFICWFKSQMDVMDDHAKKRKPLDRKFWSSHDATLLHEGFFVIGTVLAFGRLAYYCLQSSRLGPLQVSMGKMAVQIGYFLILCLIINTAFSIPLTRMYAYYDGMKQRDKDGNEKTQLSSFSTFSNSFLTLFWGMFGMSPVESADVIVENLSGDPKNPVLNSHGFTQGVGRGLFAVYELLMIIALVNTLIAILSNTFQRVVDNSDVEFKFHRTKLWTHFFDDSTLLPSPFNLLPTSSFFIYCGTYCKALSNQTPGDKAKFTFARGFYVEHEKDDEINEQEYKELMSNLAMRYFRAKEQEE